MLLTVHVSMVLYYSMFSHSCCTHSWWWAPRGDKRGDYSQEKATVYSLCQPGTTESHRKCLEQGYLRHSCPYTNHHTHQYLSSHAWCYSRGWFPEYWTGNFNGWSFHTYPVSWRVVINRCHSPPGQGPTSQSAWPKLKGALSFNARPDWCFFFANVEPCPPPRGTCNPLAFIADLQENGTIDHSAELGVMEAAAGLQARWIYSNPVYEIEKAKREAQDERQDRTAPSNIIVPGKKRPAAKTESLNIPIKDSIPNQPLRETKTLPVGIVQQDVQDSRVSGNELDKIALEVPNRLPTISHEGDQVSVSVPTSSQTTEVSANTAITVSVRDTTVPHPQRTKANIQSIISTGSEQTVQELRLRFESSPPPSSPPATTSVPYASSSSVSTTGRRLSCDNSDSGRESMVFEHELNSPTAIDSVTSWKTPVMCWSAQDPPICLWIVYIFCIQCPISAHCICQNCCLCTNGKHLHTVHLQAICCYNII